MDLPSFDTPLARTAWVQAQLKVLGSSFSQIARDNGWHPNSVSSAMFRPGDPQEAAIAKVLGVTQEALFPERFDPLTGRRLHRKVADSEGRGNAKKPEAA